MRGLFLLSVLLAVGGCQKKVAVSTSKELIANPQLLAEWQAKCDTGEYSHRPATQKADMCFTTRAAGQSVAAQEAGQADLDFYEANTRRKVKKP